MKKQPHPAIALYSRLFDEVAATETPVNPTHYVTRSWFRQKCRSEGIDIPENFIDQLAWEEAIGLRKHVKKTITAHHRRHGTTPSPMDRGADRLERQLNKINR